MFAFLGFPAPTAILSLDQYLIDFDLAKLQ